MSISTAKVLQRVAVRTSAAVWRQRYLALAGLVAVSGFGVFQVTSAAPMRTQSAAAAGTDCADLAMKAVAKKDPQIANEAYGCLGEEFSRGMSQEQFVRSMSARGVPAAEHLERVADRGTPDGGHIVFYLVGNRSGSVGYIVYLDRAGKVQKIE